jgi:hypothetical protein
MLQQAVQTRLVPFDVFVCVGRSTGNPLWRWLILALNGCNWFVGLLIGGVFWFRTGNLESDTCW